MHIISARCHSVLTHIILGRCRSVLTQRVARQPSRVLPSACLGTSLLCLSSKRCLDRGCCTPRLNSLQTHFLNTVHTVLKTLKIMLRLFPSLPDAPTVASDSVRQRPTASDSVRQRTDARVRVRVSASVRQFRQMSDSPTVPTVTVQFLSCVVLNGAGG